MPSTRVLPFMVEIGTESLLSAPLSLLDLMLGPQKEEPET